MTAFSGPDVLTLQTQPTDVTCVHTCIAMILGIPVDKVIERYGNTPITGFGLCAILEECGVLWNQFVFGTLIHEGWYLACVPSLNHVGKNHQIILWSEYGETIRVLDPARAKKYAEDGSDLHCWEGLIAFVPGGKLPD
jgi:hypothetical protein